MPLPHGNGFFLVQCQRWRLRQGQAQRTQGPGNTLPILIHDTAYRVGHIKGSHGQSSQVVNVPFASGGPPQITGQGPDVRPAGALHNEIDLVDGTIIRATPTRVRHFQPADCYRPGVGLGNILTRTGQFVQGLAILFQGGKHGGNLHDVSPEQLQTTGHCIGRFGDGSRTNNISFPVQAVGSGPEADGCEVGFVHADQEGGQP